MKKINEVVEKKIRPVKVLQYGEGNFLRAFATNFVDILNEKTDFNGNVVMVQPINYGLKELINEQKGLYTTLLRGIKNGESISEKRLINCVDSCINPYSDYDEYIKLSENPDLRFVISNTTEAGIAYKENQTFTSCPPDNFPAKVCSFLYARYTYFNADESKGLVFIPCELIDKNGTMLKQHVLTYAKEWNLENSFIAWINDSCHFLNSLVDRIVTGYPKEESATLCKEFNYEDKLIDTAEFFHLWVIEGKSFVNEFPTDKAGLNVIWTDDMSFYRTRKVRILNGAHTSTVLAAYLKGLNTVKECMDDSLVSAYLEKCLFSEIIPSMDGDKNELVSYAKDVLDRFKNPYIVHLLLSISLNSISKFKTRDLPSLLSYIEKYNTLPTCLIASLSSLIAFYEGKEIKDNALIGKRSECEYKIYDNIEYLELFKALYSKEYKNLEEKAETIAKSILSQDSWWSMDLTKIEGLCQKVENNLITIWKEGITSLLKEVSK